MTRFEPCSRPWLIDRYESRDIRQAAHAALSQATRADATQDETAVGGGEAQGSLEGAMGSTSQSFGDLLLEQLSQAQAETAVGGGTAQGSLEGVRESASQSPEDLLEQLRQAQDELSVGGGTAQGTLGGATGSTYQSLGDLFEQLSQAQAETAVGGGTAQGSLGGATESTSQSPEDLLEQLRQAAKDENDFALSSARGSLVQAVAAASQKELPTLLDLLLPAAQDWNGLVRAAAFEALLQAPLEELLAHYWSTPDTRLIPYITPRLYHTPLVIAQSVRSGHQRVFLYAAAGQAREWRQPQRVVEDFKRHVQDAVSQLSQVESKLSAHIDKSVWEQYFGAVGEEPALPDGIEAILNSPCPFWGGRQVRDTHLLVLIPKRVSGHELTLGYLGELIKSPQGNGHGTKYRFYYVRNIGNQSPDSSYWVLMTRDVLPGSRNKIYADQCALVADHANRTGLSYEVPGALEAAVVMLLHHVRSGERLYSDSPWTYTRCRESVVVGDNDYPVVVGGFSSGGLRVDIDYDRSNFGVSALRKFSDIGHWIIGRRGPLGHWAIGHWFRPPAVGRRLSRRAAVDLS